MLARHLSILGNDVQTWGYLKDNFTMSKSQILLRSIGSDHAMEQENKNFKVTGAVIGLTVKPSALNHFCLTATISNANLMNTAKNMIPSTVQRQNFTINSLVHI